MWRFFTVLCTCCASLLFVVVYTCSMRTCWLPRLWKYALTRWLGILLYQIRGLPNLPEYERLGLLCCDLENAIHIPPCLENISSCDLENRYFHVWWFEFNQCPKGEVYFLEFWFMPKRFRWCLHNFQCSCFLSGFRLRVGILIHLSSFVPSHTHLHTVVPSVDVISESVVTFRYCLQ